MQQAGLRSSVCPPVATTMGTPAAAAGQSDTDALREAKKREKAELKAQKKAAKLSRHSDD